MKNFIFICIFMLFVTQNIYASQENTNEALMQRAIAISDTDVIIDLILKGISPNTKHSIFNVTPIGELIKQAALFSVHITKCIKSIDNYHQEMKTIKENTTLLSITEMIKYKPTLKTCQALHYPFISNYYRHMQHFTVSRIRLQQHIEEKNDFYKEYNKLTQGIELALNKGACLSYFHFSDCAFAQDECLPYVFKHYPKQIDINKQTRKGNTALHKAVKYDNESYDPNFDHKSRVEILLALGADPKMKNNKGITPIELAQLPVLQNLLTEESVRALQLPAYKKHGKEKNICRSIRNREAGMQRKRIGK